jgi:hypothetical protein
MAFDPASLRDFATSYTAARCRSERLQRCRTLFPSGQPFRERRHSRAGQKGQYQHQARLDWAPVRISGFDMWSIGEDGLIAQSMGYYDSAAYRRQLDAVQREGKLSYLVTS